MTKLSLLKAAQRYTLCQLFIHGYLPVAREICQRLLRAGKSSDKLDNLIIELELAKEEMNAEYNGMGCYYSDNGSFVELYDPFCNAIYDTIDEYPDTGFESLVVVDNTLPEDFDLPF